MILIHVILLRLWVGSLVISEYHRKSSIGGKLMQLHSDRIKVKCQFSNQHLFLGVLFISQWFSLSSALSLIGIIIYQQPISLWSADSHLCESVTRSSFWNETQLQMCGGGSSEPSMGNVAQRCCALVWVRTRVVLRVITEGIFKRR